MNQTAIEVGKRAGVNEKLGLTIRSYIRDKYVD